MDILNEVSERKILIRRLLIYIGFGVLLYYIKDMLNLFLLTFIFAYLVYSFREYISSKLDRFIKIPKKILTIFVYLSLISLSSFIVIKYIPLMISESKTVLNQVIVFYNGPHKNPIEQYLVELVRDLTKDINIEGYINNSMNFIFQSLTSIGHWGFNFFVSVILSLIFLLEREKIINFLLGFRDSKMKFVYDEVQFFGTKFLLSFGKVMQTQITIAFVNTILSTILLWIMGFPQILGLSLMIFILSLVPVVGTIISLIPLSMIAFNIGGIEKMLYVWIMIAVIHAIESYFLNPKLMSNKTKLPVFFTFIVLIVSEHFMGVWGLIIGIPIFMFLISILGGDSKENIKAKL